MSCRTTTVAVQMAVMAVMAVKNLPTRGRRMNKYVMWAIDPKNKPSMSELRDAFSESDDKLLRRRQSCGYYSVKIGSVGVIPIRDALYNSDYTAFPR
jgi:hypothetical protein